MYSNISCDYCFSFVSHKWFSHNTLHKYFIVYTEKSWLSRSSLSGLYIQVANIHTRLISESSCCNPCLCSVHMVVAARTLECRNGAQWEQDSQCLWFMFFHTTCLSFYHNLSIFIFFTVFVWSINLVPIFKSYTTDIWVLWEWKNIKFSLDSRICMCYSIIIFYCTNCFMLFGQHLTPYNLDNQDFFALSLYINI